MSDEQFRSYIKGRGRERPPVGSDPALVEAVAEIEVEDTFLRAVDEGRRRISRRLIPLIATGLVGGIDVGTGVLALLLVENATHSMLLGGIAFSVGFIALALARSELFTEDFLIPVSTVIARQAKVRGLVRLWVGTLAGNLAGGWLFTWLIIVGFPELSGQAVESGSYYVHLGITMKAFALAVIGGAVITLMTWMQHGSESAASKIIPAITAAFLLAAGQLNHTIVNSLLMFTALHTSNATFGYLQWAETAGWAALGNVVGGVGLVTLLRIVQVPHAVKAERENPAPGVVRGDDRESELPEDLD
ncbi:MAG: formate/nitrite transporter family protein [Actinomycetota bacterium]|nr:MAG: formate/nitrite transporter family protein [Actinomycetota bacterium]